MLLLKLKSLTIFVAEGPLLSCLRHAPAAACYSFPFFSLLFPPPPPPPPPPFHPLSFLTLFPHEGNEAAADFLSRKASPPYGVLKFNVDGAAHGKLDWLGWVVSFGIIKAGRDLRFLSTTMSGCLLFGGLLLMLLSNKGFGLRGFWWALAGFQWARFSLALQRVTSPQGMLYCDEFQQPEFGKLKAT